VTSQDLKLLQTNSSVTERGQGASRPPGKLNVKTGPYFAYILIFRILLGFQ